MHQRIEETAREDALQCTVTQDCAKPMGVGQQGGTSGMARIGRKERCAILIRKGPCHLVGRANPELWEGWP